MEIFNTVTGKTMRVVGTLGLNLDITNGRNHVERELLKRLPNEFETFLYDQEKIYNILIKYRGVDSGTIKENCMKRFISLDIDSLSTYRGEAVQQLFDAMMSIPENNIETYSYILLLESDEVYTFIGRTYKGMTYSQVTIMFV